jgi:photosystem II stability/assembly factor-like uncharacterized protein
MELGDPAGRALSGPAGGQGVAPPAFQSLPWVRTGGPIGGLGYDVRYNFGDHNTWYVTDAWAGLHMSTDNGQTWFPSNQGITTRTGGGAADAIPIFSATVDPHDPDIVWIGTQNFGDIFKSLDGGYTWQEKTNGIDPTLAPAVSFRGFTVDPTTSDIVYAMAEISSWGWTPDGSERKGLEMDMTQGIVYKTVDGGENWTEIWRGNNLARYCWIEPRDPHDPDDDVLYVSTGIFDREAANTDVAAGKAGGVGILKSIDGGQTWSVINQAQGLLDLYVGSLYMHPTKPNTLLAAASQNNWSNYGSADTSGVFLTEDGGLSWTRVLSDEMYSAVEYCTANPKVAYAGSAEAVYRSGDGGRTWQRFGRPDGTWGPPGIIAGFPIDMQCDPVDPMRIFVNNYLGGNFLSVDGGQTWTMASQGYTGAQIGQLHVVPGQANSVYAGGRSGLFRSSQSGNSWVGLANPGPGMSGIGLNEVLTLALNPADSRHLLAYVDAGAIYSQDAGMSWQMSSGLPKPAPGMAFAPSNPAVAYAAVVPRECGDLASPPADRSECDKPDAGLYVSANGGASWTPAGGAAPSGKAMLSLAVHPSNPSIVYAGTYIHGVLKTGNGGQTWTAGTGLPSNAAILSLALDPSSPNTIFAGLDGGGVYRSENGGGTWHHTSAGLNPEAKIESIVVDPTDGQIVYLTDHISGVYVSKNGGDTWQALNEGLVHRTTKALSLSQDGTTLYLGVWGDGVYRLGTPKIAPLYLPMVLQRAGG